MGCRKKITSFLVVLILLVFSTTPALSVSSYVLPYPSAMPGSKVYLLHVLEEKVLKYWYFGDFGRLLFDRQLSDKYLVEAKTLFEYRQYLLASGSLKKSDVYFLDELHILSSISEKKNGLEEQRKIFSEQSMRHQEVLLDLRELLPRDFVWEAEKSSPQTLHLYDQISSSIEIRKETDE
jgi:hypothetical protein